MIDIRSDTVTTPTKEMLHAMSNARVGDDVFSEDFTVNELQEFVANECGKESALFMPSGCMSNQIALAIHSKAGDEVLVESESHIFHYETAAPSIIARVQLRCVDSIEGNMLANDVVNSIRPGAYYFPKTSLLCVENTHNRHGGTVVKQDAIEAMANVCKERDIAFHCDGARIWNAAAATNIALTELCKPFDTVSVCLSKGLGAPIGSVLVGSAKHIEKARRWRKLLGGGMRQVGVLAAAGLHALRNHREYLHDDHRNASKFASILFESGFYIVDNFPTQTNIVVFKPKGAVSAAMVIEEAEKLGVRISNGREGGFLRAVFHFQVSMEDAIRAAHCLCNLPSVKGIKV